MNNKLKLDHELGVGKDFIRLYNIHNKSSYDFINLGNPSKKEPDCIYNDFAAEIVDISNNSTEHQYLWDIAKGKNVPNLKPFKLTLLDSITPSISSKLFKLNEGLYGGYPGKIILICNLISPLIDDKDVERYIGEHTPFRYDEWFEKYFHEIWFYWRSIPQNRIAKLE